MSPETSKSPHRSNTLREPPHSLEAEQYLLSCCFVDGAETLARCLAAGVGANSFYSVPNQKVFAHVQDLHARGLPVTTHGLAVALQASGQLAEIGGFPYIAQISDKMPTTAEAAAFAERVANLALLRHAIAQAAALTEAAFAANADGQAVVQETIARLSSIASGAQTRRAPTWPEIVASATTTAEGIIAGRPEIAAQSLSWPWPIADRAFMPMRRGELVILAARPSVGKSSLLRQIVVPHAARGAQVLLLSMEMRGEEIAWQAAASASGVPFSQLANVHPAEQKAYLDTLRGMGWPSLHVFDQDFSVSALATRVRAITARAPLDLLAIDYLGLFADCEASRQDTKAAAIGRVTKALKRLANETNVPIVLLAQLNRDSAKLNREPTLTDLRDSGDIEQDADRVLFLHRPDVDPLTSKNQSANEDATDRPRDFVNLIQAKGRNVGQGQILSLYFQRATTTFTPAIR